MRFSPRVLAPSLIVLASGLLGSCATPTAPQTATTLRPAEAAGDHLADSRTSAYGLYLAGEAALDSGESAAAERLLSRASARAPEAGLIRERAFTAALLAGNTARASELAPEGTDGDASTRALGRLVRGVEALADGRAKAALADFTPPAGERTPNGAAVLLRPWAAAAAGDWQTALAAPASSDKLFVLFNGLSRAELLERAGRTAEAEALYRTLTAGQAAGVFTLGYGGFLERRGRGAEAVKLYNAALAQNPDSAALRAARGRAAAGRPGPAMPSFREGAAQALLPPAALMLAEKQTDVGLAFARLALRLDPKLDEAWELCGEALLQAGNQPAAREAFGRVRPGTAEYASARGRLAAMLQQAGDKAGALKLARETLQTAPEDPEAQALLADLLQDDERYDEAVQVLDRLVAETGNGPSAWRYRYQRGASLERAGHWPQAEADLQAALKLRPGDPELLNYLGFAWVDRGEHLSEALGMLEKAVQLEPKSGAVIDSLGWAHYRLGDYQKSLGELERAVELQPADPEINDHLGDLYWRLGRKVEAQYQWKRVLTLEPEPKIRARAETKLAEGLPPAPTTSVAAAGRS